MKEPGDGVGPSVSPAVGSNVGETLETDVCVGDSLGVCSPSTVGDKLGDEFAEIEG